MTQTVEWQVEEEVLAAFRREADEYGAELRLAAAVKWYELGRISQERAAQVAGLTRRDFLFALSHYRVSPFQTNTAELEEELARG